MFLPDIRENYTKGTLLEKDIPSNPLVLFDKWLEDVVKANIPDPNAMTLATVDKQNRPSQRIVLLKDRPEDKFVFYSNYESNKAKDMALNRSVSLHFPWYLLERQVMVTGSVEQSSKQQSQEYFSSRPKQSQVGAWVSKQSQPLHSRAELVEKYQGAMLEYASKAVPLPNWGGYVVTPLEIEFWQGGSHRLHDRIRYSRSSVESTWTFARLNP